MNACTAEGCDRHPNAGRGMCKMHWQQWREANADPCTVEGCDRRQRARNLCSMHVQRLERNGTVELIERQPRPLEDRLWPRVTPAGFCWEWEGAHAASGYGVINLGPRLDRTHRVVYEMLVGPIPEGLHMDHLCRNRGCCNPDHLDPVTPRENMIRGMAPSHITARTGVCRRGHTMADAYTRPDTGARTCRTCLTERSRRRRNATS
jgi:hypothetical protein